MPNPAILHAATAVELPAAEIREAVILDDAVTPGDSSRCVIPEFDHRLTTDPCRFTPVSTKAGWFYPKKGDRAIVCQHEDGPDAILAWWPAAGAEPDDTP